MDYVRRYGPITCDAIEALSDLSHQSVSARVHDLRERGFLRDSGKKELTRSRRRAVAYEVTKR